ncbi:MAG TPA: DUF1015 domain-containing protein [Elusimicrobiota bacterium]|jgi:uncharacterized protein (DUF1015 family)|nr:DUF1015 domain-containing protein [Elusimicrobiota bacterium]
MAEVKPFRGVRFVSASLDEALCPPYDVIPAELAKALRRRPRNSVFLELPQGEGAERYARAKAAWKKWNEDGTLARDARPAFYVVEETYRLAGRTRVRRGFLAALGATPKAAKAIIPHERTLAKPKADRLRMLNALRVNVSPIFGVFADPSGAARRALAAAAKAKPVARGKSHAGVAYKLWRADDPRLVADLERALAPRSILIADGHHRYSVSRDHHAATKLPGSDAVLTYLVPDEDAGLVVLPTHRIAAKSLLARAEALAALEKFGTLAELERALARAKNPYAFGLIEKGFRLGIPKSAGGCRSGLAVEWLGSQLLGGTRPDELSYTPDSGLAVKKAKAVSGAAVLVKPFTVAQVRRAAKAVGLLPQKSTYFFPKIATGLAFRPLAP